IYHQEVFRDREQAEFGIAQMIHAYNHVRPHMSIGMNTPMSVYRGLPPGPNLWKKEKECL
ncbi:MAG: integrase core domain-containing protein, partial [Bacteroidales bacterium]|nr:integrase core domain-containing protein [Bacteroidales bacterium]